MRTNNFKAQRGARVTVLFLWLLLCQQANAIRSMCTWQELLDSSDFIVLAEAVQVNEYIGSEPTITFSILRIFKGDPPSTLTFPCTKGIILDSHTFATQDRGKQYLLFCEKEGSAYSMAPQRYVEKEFWFPPFTPEQKELLGIGKRQTPPVARLSRFLKNFPTELEKKIFSRGKYYPQCIAWDDLIEWLDAHYSR